jgi:hypothetical protein
MTDLNEEKQHLAEKEDERKKYNSIMDTSRTILEENESILIINYRGIQ